MSSPAVLINVFEVPVGKEDEFIDWWKRSSEALRQEPGFIDARLHRNLKLGARFQFINVAHWESTEALDLARDRNRELLHSLLVGKGTPGLYEVAVQY